MIERMRVAISLRDVASYRATRHTLRVLRTRARARDVAPTRALRLG